MDDTGGCQDPNGDQLPPPDSSTMDTHTHAFVVKVWMDEPSLWRGYITHAYSGQRRYFQDLNKILEFIRMYLEQEPP